MEHKQPLKAKGEDNESEFKKSREYKRFRTLLKRVVKAPPMRKGTSGKLTQSDGTNSP